ncbi:hypothetical protein SDC9_92293 [bioreactor metagenome]|uniref:Uncharacterized protein n=1 Tax=bioreactor metagenome TaxID=1076179 RepID=A0A644ZXF2_9ZZZZ
MVKSTFEEPTDPTARALFELMEGYSDTAPLALKAQGWSPLQYEKIFQCVDYLRREGKSTSFSMSASSLADWVRRIDCFGPQHYGFIYEKRLREECELVVPIPITEQDSLTALFLPFVRERANRHVLSLNGAIRGGIALGVMHRLIRAYPTRENLNFVEVLKRITDAYFNEG